MLNPVCSFIRLGQPRESVDKLENLTPSSMGLPSALDGFVTLLATSKDKLGREVLNIAIRQDGDLD